MLEIPIYQGFIDSDRLISELMFFRI